MTLKERIEARKKAKEAGTPPLAESKPVASGGKMIAQASASPVLSYKEQMMLQNAQDSQESERKASEEPKTFVRKLNETSEVGDVPYVFPSASDSPREKLWKATLISETSTLGVWIDKSNPTAECAWLAVEIAEMPGALALLAKLPLLTRREETNPF